MRLFGTKPLSEPMLCHCHLDPYRNKLKSNCVWNLNTFIQENQFKNVVWKMSAILSLPRNSTGNGQQQRKWKEMLGVGPLLYQMSSHWPVDFLRQWRSGWHLLWTQVHWQWCRIVSLMPYHWIWGATCIQHMLFSSTNKTPHVSLIVVTQTKTTNLLSSMLPESKWIISCNR